MAKRPSDGNDLKNPELVVLAAYLEGGQHRAVESEDIAIRVFDLAPNRFGWRKHPKHIDIFVVRSALSDARKPEHGELLVGSDRKGWQLSPKGLKFVEANLSKLGNVNTSEVRQTPEERRRQLREKQRLLVEPAWQKYAQGDLDKITPVEAEHFFRLDDYVVGAARRRRIDRLLVMFANDAELGPACQAIAPIVRDVGGADGVG